MDQKNKLAATKTNDNTRPKKLSFGLLFIMLCLLGAQAFSGWQGFLLKNTLATQEKKQSDHFSQLKTQITAMQEDRQRLTHQIDMLRETQSTQTKQIESLLLVSHRNQTDWLLIGIAERLRLANLNLHFNEDVHSTLVLLEETDKDLLKLHDPALLPLRESIAQDLAQLRTLPEVDIEGLLMTIAGIKENLKTLVFQPMPTPSSDIASINSTPPTTENLPAWQQGLQRLKGLLIIRHNQPTVTPLLLPEQMLTIKQNVFYLLQQGEWALLSNKKALYEQSLQQAINYLEKPFVAENNVLAKNMRAVLRRLAAQNIRVTPPTLTAQKTAEKLIDARMREVKTTNAAVDISNPVSGA